MPKMISIDGLEVIQSALDQANTLAQVKAELADRDMTIFAHIDHAAGALEAGLKLDPTDLILFGNPAAGTLLMQEQQSAGIDLPLKILIWTPADGITRLAYDRPSWIGVRHHIAGPATATITRMDSLLGAIAARVRA